MKFELYSVKDSLAEEFGPIFQCKNDAVACRMFGQMFTVNEAADLLLYKLGMFDTEKGILVCRPKAVDTSTVVFAPDSPHFGGIRTKEKLDDVTGGISDEKSTVIE